MVALEPATTRRIARVMFRTEPQMMHLAQRHLVFIPAVFRRVIQMRDGQNHNTATMAGVSLPTIRPVRGSPLLRITLEPEDQFTVKRAASGPLATAASTIKPDAAADLAPALWV